MGLPSADANGPLARSLVADLLSLPPAERRPWYRKLEPRDLAVVFAGCRRELGSTFGLWQDDPAGFMEDVIGATLWGKQIEVVESVRDHVRTSVPATHAPGKTFTGGMLVAWWCSVWPPGTFQAITTAPKFRQVRNIMWPGIRRAQAAGRLPGTIQTAQWKIDGEVVAYGFSAAEHDEDAVQGIHATHVLFIVDEAGGISKTLGASYAAILSQPHARMALFGNPPTDEEGTWFEEQSERSEDLVHTVRIPARSTPNFTGERTGRCTSCPAGAPPHRVAAHLTTHEWVNEVLAEFGSDSAFAIARVDAEFPRSIGQKVIPLAWVEDAAEQEPGDPAGKWVRLGCDIASEGGDEFVIARSVGFAVGIVHRSSGAANADPVNVAGKITEHVRAACELATTIGSTRRVHVKIDASGLGWGVAGLVKRQVIEAGLLADVYGIRAEGEPHDDTQFRNIRSEMWWNTRRLIKPTTDPETGAVTAPGKLALVDVPLRLHAQLSAPKYATDAAGRTVVEKKKETKRRVGGSPDLADAINLCLYEPPGISPASIEPSAPVTIPTRPTQGNGSSPGGVIPIRPTGR